MGKYILPVLVIGVGFAAAYAGWKMVKNYTDASTPPVGGSVTGMGRFALGQVLRPESDWEKYKRAEGLLLSIG